MVKINNPDGDGEELFAALKSKVSEMARSYNETAIPELGGLSPDECHELLVVPWEAKGAPLKLNRGLSLAELEESPFFRHTRAFLLDLNETGGAKLTATGNLTRAFVASQIDNFCNAEEKETLLDICKVINETDLFRLHVSRIVCQVGGLIGRSKGKFQVRKKHLSLLKPERAGDLFAHLFHSFFRQFNLAYLSRLMGEFSGIQHRIAYSLYRLWSHEDRWIGLEELPGIALFEADRREVEHAITGHTYQTLERITEFRLIYPLEYWGFVETRDEDSVRKLKTFCRVTPLFRKAIRFEFE